MCTARSGNASWTVLASLDIEVVPELLGELVLENLEMNISHGQVESIVPVSSGTTACTLHGGDHFSKVYSLQRSCKYSVLPDSAAPSISLSASASVISPKDRRRILRTVWTTSLHELAVADEPQGRAYGLTLAVSGPRSITVQSILVWSLLVTNTSSKRSPDVRLAPVISSTTARPPALICLTPDVRIRSLLAGASVTAEMRFLAAQIGLAKVDAIRVMSSEVDAADSGEAHAIVEVLSDMLPKTIVVKDTES